MGHGKHAKIQKRIRKQQENQCASQSASESCMGDPLGPLILTRSEAFALHLIKRADRVREGLIKSRPAAETDAQFEQFCKDIHACRCDAASAIMCLLPDSIICERYLGAFGSTKTFARHGKPHFADESNVKSSAAIDARVTLSELSVYEHIVLVQNLRNEYLMQRGTNFEKDTIRKKHLVELVLRIHAALKCLNPHSIIPERFQNQLSVSHFMLHGLADPWKLTLDVHQNKLDAEDGPVTVTDEFTYVDLEDIGKDGSSFIRCDTSEIEMQKEPFALDALLSKLRVDVGEEDWADTVSKWHVICEAQSLIYEAQVE